MASPRRSVSKPATTRKAQSVDGMTRPSKLSGSRQTLAQPETLAACRVSAEDLARSGCSWEDLEWIFTLHERNSDTLRATAQFLADSLRRIPEVHSLKFRVKDPYHLIAKVIRKRLEDPTREISPDNYATALTDLVGLRALHLYKTDWLPIHTYVTRCWTQHEQPTAYHRKGDPLEVVRAFEQAGCQSREHPAAYRSVHYLLECRPTNDLVIAELQVRTVFEEGWSEIDHLVRYPHSTSDELLNQYLTLFNRAAGIADEMGSFLQRLKAELADRERRAATERMNLEGKIAELESEISKLQISDKERGRLAKELAEVKRAQSSSAKASASASLSEIILGQAWQATDYLRQQSVQFPTAVAYPSPPVPAAASFAAVSARKCSSCGREIPFGSLIAADKCTHCLVTTSSTRKTP